MMYYEAEFELAGPNVVFKMIFKFTGGEITNEFLLSSGYLKGAHDKDCPIYHEVLKRKPKWFLG